jgi:hypothetical protein
MELWIAIGVRLEKEKGESDNRHSAPITLGVPTADSLSGFMSLLISRSFDFLFFLLSQKFRLNRFGQKTVKVATGRGDGTWLA